MASKTIDQKNVEVKEHQLHSETCKDNHIPRSVKAYLDPSYWDKRFSKEDHHEWLKDYSQFRHLLTSCICSSDRVLELGCGSSQMCDGLLGDGIGDITCIDISPIAVQKMQKRLTAKSFHEVKVMVADMLNLPFESGVFDVVIEKCTMDVLLVDNSDPWNPNKDTINRVLAMLTNVHRVLTSEGTFISISFGQPHFRRPFFERNGFTWSMQWKTFGDGFHYFCYILKKGTKNGNLTEDTRNEKPVKFGESLYQEHLDSENYLLQSLIGIDDGNES